MELLTLGRYILLFPPLDSSDYMDYLASYHEDISIQMSGMHGFAKEPQFHGHWFRLFL